MWRLDVLFVPVELGATRYVNKDLKKYLKKIPDKRTSKDREYSPEGASVNSLNAVDS